MSGTSHLSTSQAASLAHFRSFLEDNEILTHDSKSYQANAQPWAVQKDQKPAIVIRPKSVTSLSRAIRYLYPSNLDFAIRGQGFGSTSARDVIVSMTAFDGFEFDWQKESAIVGAGQTWGEVYEKMENAAPEFALVGARTPAVGVGGTVVTGGISWLSGEYGCISDPANMLDAEVVKTDGSVIWASQSPTFCGHYEAAAILFVIWAGPILLPRKTLPEVAKGVAAFGAGGTNPRTGMFLYVMDKRVLKTIGIEEDMLVIHAFDANGEEHGREAFKWALSIPGAVDQTSVMNIRRVANLQGMAGSMKGRMKQFWAPLLLTELTEDTITKSIRWLERIKQLGGTIGESTYLAFELICSRDPIGCSLSDCAWPRPAGSKHILLLGPGCRADAAIEEENLAKEIAIKAPADILGETAPAHIPPNSVEDYHDPRSIWRDNYDKLVSLKQKYDPQGRLKGPFR